MQGGTRTKDGRMHPVLAAALVTGSLLTIWCAAVLAALDRMVWVDAPRPCLDLVDEE